MRARWFVLLLIPATASADTFRDTYQYVDTDGVADTDTDGDTDGGSDSDTDTGLPYPSGGVLASELAGAKGCAGGCDAGGGLGAVGVSAALLALVARRRRVS